MIRMLALAVLLAAASAPVTAAAQTSEDVQGWANLTATGSISGRLTYFAEVQPRFADDASRLDQLLLRPAIGWRVSDEVTLFQGYARVANYVADGADRLEDRSFQQLGWTRRLNARAEIQSRTRLEQRWRSDGDGMGLRLREMIRGEIALSPSGEGVRALGYAELFVGLKASEWSRTGFDQLRSFAGLEVPVGGRSTLELGYLNQAVDQPGRAWRMNHVAAVALFVRH
jgi:hypothetical protein